MIHLYDSDLFKFFIVDNKKCSIWTKSFEQLRLNTSYWLNCNYTEMHSNNMRVLESLDPNLYMTCTLETTHKTVNVVACSSSCAVMKSYMIQLHSQHSNSRNLSHSSNVTHFCKNYSLEIFEVDISNKTVFKELIQSSTGGKI